MRCGADQAAYRCNPILLQHDALAVIQRPPVESDRLLWLTSMSFIRALLCPHCYLLTRSDRTCSCGAAWLCMAPFEVAPHYLHLVGLQLLHADPQQLVSSLELTRLTALICPRGCQLGKCCTSTVPAAPVACTYTSLFVPCCQRQALGVCRCGLGCQSAYGSCDTGYPTGTPTSPPPMYSPSPEIAEAATPPVR